MTGVLQVGIVGLAVCLAAMGLALLLKGERLLELFAHRRDALVGVFAGRYLAMAGMTTTLALMQEWRALAVVLAVGAVMGLLDAVLVGRAGGARLPHIIATSICLVLAAGCLAVGQPG
jgi:ribose/xylose/arabinose/galactoside ABC-type transport system permease subunit